MKAKVSSAEKTIQRSFCKAEFVRANISKQHKTVLNYCKLWYILYIVFEILIKCSVEVKEEVGV